MYIISDFQEEDRRKKSIAPWLVGGVGLAAGGVGLALASKGKGSVQKDFDNYVKKVRVRDASNEAEQLIKQQEILNQIKKASQGKLATGFTGKSKTERAALIAKRKGLLKEGSDKIESTLKMEKPDSSTGTYRFINNKQNIPAKIRKSVNKTSQSANKLSVLNAQDIAKTEGIEYMKYTNNANFAMAGAMGGGLKTGVLNRVTGQLGDIANKAKGWLQNAKKAKEEVVGSATIAKQRLQPKPYVSPNLQAEAIARRKYGSVGVENAPQLESTIGKKSKSLDDSLKLRSSAQLRTDLTQGSARQINRGSSDRFSKPGSAAAISDNRSLRLRYTKDPRTVKLVSAAYKAHISLLCDI